MDDPDFQGIEFETYIGRYGILLCAIRIPSVCVESLDRENGEVTLRSYEDILRLRPEIRLCTFEAYIEGDDFVDAYFFNLSSHNILTRVEIRLSEYNVPKVFRTIIDAQNFNWTIDSYKQVF